MNDNDRRNMALGRYISETLLAHGIEHVEQLKLGKVAVAFKDAYVKVTVRPDLSIAVLAIPVDRTITVESTIDAAIDETISKKKTIKRRLITCQTNLTHA